jgi:hypothetical protein
MSARSRPPTDEQRTVIHDGPPRRAHTSTRRGVSKHDERDDEPTERSEPPRHGDAVEQATPTEVRRPERSEPIKVVSMKTPAEVAVERRGHAAVPVVQIRSLSEVKRMHDTPPGGFGTLAPPRDPKGVAVRKLRDFVIWGCAVVIVACGVMLGVWFLARR